MYNSDTVYSTTVFRPVSLSPTIFPDIETPPPQRTRKLETPLHFDGGLFSDIRSSDGKLLSKVTVDRMHSSTRRDVVDTPHVSESSDALGNKDYVDDIVKTETITNEDVFKVKFTPVTFDLDDPRLPTKLSVERPRTPVIRPTLIERPITPFNAPMTDIDRSTTPIYRSITPIDRPITPLNVPMTHINRPTTPIDRSITSIDRPITPLNLPMALFDRQTTPFDGPITPFDQPITTIDRPITPLNVPTTLFDLPTTPLDRPKTPINRPITPIKIITNDYEDLQSYKIIKSLLKEHSTTKTDNLNNWNDKVNLIDVRLDEPVKRAHSPLANFIVSEQLTKIDSYLQESLNVCSEYTTETNSKLIKLDEERETGMTHETLKTTKMNESTISNNENNITSQSYVSNVGNSSNNVKEPTVKYNAVEEIPATPHKVNSVKAKRPGVVSAICNMPMHYHAAILCFFLIVYNLIYQYIKQNHHGIKK